MLLRRNFAFAFFAAFIYSVVDAFAPQYIARFDQSFFLPGRIGLRLVHGLSSDLDFSYKLSKNITKTCSKTFYFGTMLMPKTIRHHIWAIYSWCRRTDDIVDMALDQNYTRLTNELETWKETLDQIWRGNVSNKYDLALASTVGTYPSLNKTNFIEMIEGMVMDLPIVGKNRYHNFSELYAYCYRVAGTVGLMTLPILGTAPGYSEQLAKEPAVSLGIAFQLTNILRDVGEDLEKGRIYIPLDEIKSFGLSEEDFLQRKVTSQYIELMRFQIDRARSYYKLAQRGIPMLSPSIRLAVQIALDLYSKILVRIERNNFDNFRYRASTSKWEKLTTLPTSFFRTKLIL